MSSSETSSSCEIDDEILSDLQKLQPYDLEPKISSSTSSDKDISSSDCETTEESRLGNTNWCLCWKCFPMLTYTESLCCLDTNEVPDEYFERMYNIISQTQHHITSQHREKTTTFFSHTKLVSKNYYFLKRNISLP